MSRRSTRLSETMSDDPFAPSSSKRQRPASSSSSRSSAASSGVIPTVAARNAAAKSSRTETRFEDLLDNSLFDGDETRRMDVSIGAFLTEPAQPKRESASRPKTKRTLRKTLGEEAEDDFVFTREPARNAKAPQHNGTTQSTQRTTFEPLSDAMGGETPIIRRNQAFRAGLEKHPRLPTGKESSSNRRSSLGLKGQKRVSSLRDGTVAYPHEQVPDHELYRHCSADLPPVVRMKHMTAWILKRSIDIAMGKQELLSIKKDKKSKAADLPMYTKAELEVLDVKKDELTAMIDQLLADLNGGAFGISWMGQSEQPKNTGLKPHPRNISNRQASASLAATVDSMTQESRAWTKELTRIEDYEAETARLEELLTSGEAEAQDVISWDRNDLDEAGLQQLQDAEAAIAALERLEAEDDADTQATTAKAKTPSRGKGRASKAAPILENAEGLQGTRRDARWKDLEFNIDLLRSRSHQFAQLETLAGKYIRTVSAHAAQALRDRTSSSSAFAGSSTSGSKRGKRKQSAAGEHVGADRLEMLLSGVRESKSISSTDKHVPTTADQSAGDITASTVFAEEPDETDPTDLLRALARS